MAARHPGLHLGARPLARSNRHAPHHPDHRRPGVIFFQWVNGYTLRQNLREMYELRDRQREEIDVLRGKIAPPQQLLNKRDRLVEDWMKGLE